MIPSMWPDITNQLLEQLQDVKDWIEEQKEDGRLVAVVHLSGDVLHASHVQYMNTIHAKLRKELWQPFKLVVWVEADSRTLQRKKKHNVYNEEERKYMFENLKVVDKAYIEFEGLDEQTNNKRPAWIIQYLAPDVMISHIEHIWNDEQDVQSRLDGKLIVVKEWDEQEYLGEESIRDKYNRSTTNTIKQIMRLYKDHPKYI